MTTALCCQSTTGCFASLLTVQPFGEGRLLCGLGLGLSAKRLAVF